MRPVPPCSPEMGEGAIGGARTSGLAPYTLTRLNRARHPNKSATGLIESAQEPPYLQHDSTAITLSSLPNHRMNL